MDIDMLIAEVDGVLFTDGLREAAGVDLDKPWGTGEQQIRAFHRLLHARPRRRTVVHPKEQRMLLAEQRLAGGHQRVGQVGLLHQLLEQREDPVALRILVNEQNGVLRGRELLQQRVQDSVQLRWIGGLQGGIQWGVGNGDL